MNARLAILIGRLIVLLDIIDGLSCHLSCLLLSLSSGKHFVVPIRFVGRFSLYIEAVLDWVSLRRYLLDHLLLISIVVMIFFLHQVIECSREGAIHVGLILGCDLLWCSTIDYISVVTDSNQKRAENDSEIEAITSLPFVENISRRGDNLG